MEFDSLGSLILAGVLKLLGLRRASSSAKRELNFYTLRCLGGLLSFESDVAGARGLARIESLSKAKKVLILQELRA